MADTHHKGLLLIRPCFGQFFKIPFNGLFHIGFNIFPTPTLLIGQGEGQVHSFTFHAFHLHHMADGGGSQAFPGVLKGVNGGLYLFHKSWGRYAEGAVNDNQLHSSAHRQLVIDPGFINLGQPSLDFFRRLNSFQPF